MSKEIWKDIPGYEGRYKISNNGEIFSLLSNKKLKPTITRKGYISYGLTKNSKSLTHRAHRLVLKAFVGDSQLEVDHKNGIKTDNRLENLEYVTSRENIHRYVKNKLSYSKYAGVYWSVQKDCWFASICINKKSIFIGDFKKEKDACLAYVDVLANGTERINHYRRRLFLSPQEIEENNSYLKESEKRKIINKGEYKRKYIPRKERELYGINHKTGEILHFTNSCEAELNGYHKGNIYACLEGKRKTHKGYSWFYTNGEDYDTKRN